MAKSTYTRDGSSTISMGELFVTTSEKRLDYRIDQIFKEKAALDLHWMLDHKDTKCLGDGGDQFVVPMEVSANPNGGWIDEEEGVNMSDYDPLEACIYTAKTVAYNLRLSRYQQRVNRGSSKIMSIIDVKEKNTIKTFRQDFREGLWQSSVGNSKKMLGLPDLIPAVATASQTTVIGAVDPSSKTWWRTQSRNMTGMVAAAKLESEMMILYDNIYLEDGKVDIIFTDPTTKRTYEENQLEFLQTTTTKIGDNNYTSIAYKNAPIVMSDLAPTGEMRYVDNDAIKFCVDPSYWMKWTDWKEQVNVPETKHKQCLSVCQLARVSARNLGCIYNIT